MPTRPTKIDNVYTEKYRICTTLRLKCRDVFIKMTMSLLTPLWYSSFGVTSTALILHFGVLWLENFSKCMALLSFKVSFISPYFGFIFLLSCLSILATSGGRSRVSFRIWLSAVTKFSVKYKLFFDVFLCGEKNVARSSSILERLRSFSSSILWTFFGIKSGKFSSGLDRPINGCFVVRVRVELSFGGLMPSECGLVLILGESRWRLDILWIKLSLKFILSWSENLRIVWGFCRRRTVSGSRSSQSEDRAELGVSCDRKDSEPVSILSSDDGDVRSSSFVLIVVKLVE